MIEPWLRFGIAFRLCWLAEMALWAMLAGCAAPPESEPPPPAAVEAPPAPVHAPPPVVPPAVSQALKRDTAAVQEHAQQFAAKPSTPVALVAGLEPLTRAVNRALAVLELHHKREGRYRPADVVAARAAADAVARFLESQPQPEQGDTPP